MREPKPKPMRKPSNHPHPQFQPQLHHPPPQHPPQTRPYHPPPPQQPPQHHHQPPHPPPYPPPPHRRPPKQRRTALASCIVATIFLIFIIIVLCIIYFSLFKPKDPKITITSIQLPTFSLSTNSTTVSFTFSLYAAVNNPNRATFTHFDSTLQLLYAGNQVGFMFIPAGQISAGRTEYMDATFSVRTFPITTSPPAASSNFPAMMGVVGPPITDGIDRVRPTLELESRLEMVGRIRVLWFFSHHVESIADCRVAVAITDGSVLGYHC